jgi:hypothetical protein
MPDALERHRVLTWYHCNLSRADKHPSACVCQQISGNLIATCLFIDLVVLPPNQRLQLTPLRGGKIVAILKPDFSSTVIPTHRCGATEAQHVGPWHQR